MPEISLLAKEGSILFQAAALRGGSDNLLYNFNDRLLLAQTAADSYSIVLNATYHSLAVALGKCRKDEDWEGSPEELLWEAVHVLESVRL